MKQKFIIALSFPVLLAACSDTENKKINTPVVQTEEPTKTELINFKEYYFPVDSMPEPLIYHYADDSGSVNMYWVLSIETINGKTFFTTESFSENENGKMQMIEVICEDIRTDGSYVSSYKESQLDVNGKPFEAVAFMHSAVVYKWFLTDKKETLVWNFESTSKDSPNYLNKTTKTRSFTGTIENIVFENDTIPAALFIDDFKVEISNKSDGRSKLYAFTQTSYYAKGIGLYKYDRVFDEYQVTYKLVEILSNDEWQRLISK